MYSIQEKCEYDKFVIEFAHKVHEIQQDFNNLSDDNKIKFQNDVMRAFMIKGIEECFKILQSMEMKRGHDL